jgi:predicted SprT family Zn-dependent metalloprotease
MPTLGKTIFELQRIFKLLNDLYYCGELIAPVITVQAQGKRSAYGWCTLQKIWRKGSNKDIPEESPERDSYYEINFCAEYLERSNEDIAETMLHEMAHLYNVQNNIKDNSRSGTYHNDKFKATAEAHGLNVQKIEKYGWAFTRLTDSAREQIGKLQINRQAFKMTRQAGTGKKKGKAKSSSRKYVCPCCGTSVRATKEVFILCGDCQETMIIES